MWNKIKLEEELNISLLCLFTRDNWGAWGDRNPAVYFVSYTDVFRHYTHVSAGELQFGNSYCSIFVANEFVSSLEMHLIYVIEKR